MCMVCAWQELVECQEHSDAMKVLGGEAWCLSGYVHASCKVHAVEVLLRPYSELCRFGFARAFGCTGQVTTAKVEVTATTAAITPHTSPCVENSQPASHAVKRACSAGLWLHLLT